MTTCFVTQFAVLLALKTLFPTTAQAPFKAHVNRGVLKSKFAVRLVARDQGGSRESINAIIIIITLKILTPSSLSYWYCSSYIYF